MKALEYHKLLKNGKIWVPKKGDRVRFHSIIGDSPEPGIHTVKSVFPAESGTMVAFISGRRAYVNIDALSRAPESSGQFYELTWSVIIRADEAPAEITSIGWSLMSQDAILKVLTDRCGLPITGVSFSLTPSKSLRRQKKEEPENEKN